MALLNVIRGEESKILSQPVSDGALLFATDTRKIYLDKGSERIEIASIQDLSNYVTSSQLQEGLATKAPLSHSHTVSQVTDLDATISAAIGEEASARQKQDQLLEQAIDDKLGADDIIAGSNVQVSHDDESGHITISATDTKYTAGTGLGMISNGFYILNGGVGLNQLANDSVSEDKLVDGAVDTAKIADGAVTADKLAAGVIPKDTNTTYTLTKSGSTITLNGSDGSKTSVTDADTNTTYSVMKGATSSAVGSSGLVPAPAAGKQTSFLRGDGTWVVPTNTTYSNMTGATTSTAGKAGLVPAPAAGAATRYLRSDGTWQVPPDTNTTYTLSSFGITATAAELNKLDGCTATVTELNYVDGVTSNIQTQLNGKASSSHTHSYLPLSGGTLTGTLTSRAIIPSTTNTYNIGTSSLKFANVYATTFVGALSGNATTATTATTATKANQLTTPRTITTNLGSTTAASFNGTANITPGITGTLAISHGGTGATTAAAARTNLGAASSDIILVQSEEPTSSTCKLWIKI